MRGCNDVDIVTAKQGVEVAHSLARFVALGVRVMAADVRRKAVADLRKELLVIAKFFKTVSDRKVWTGVGSRQEFMEQCFVAMYSVLLMQRGFVD